MPVKTITIKLIKCECGRHTKAEFKPATRRIELTPFQCQCGQDFKIIDYMNGTTVYHKMK